MIKRGARGRKSTSLILLSSGALKLLQMTRLALPPQEKMVHNDD
jgi:hypothetical protein